jgi:hypothetical protein
MARNPFVGYWKITHMDVWNLDYVDMVVPGFFELKPDSTGTFQFGTVARWMDTRIRKVGDASYIEWSWEGQDDNDPGCGRGWATLAGDELVGHIFIHRGDDSPFTAKRQAPPQGRT